MCVCLCRIHQTDGFTSRIYPLGFARRLLFLNIYVECFYLCLCHSLYINVYTTATYICKLPPLLTNLYNTTSFLFFYFFFLNRFYSKKERKNKEKKNPITILSRFYICYRAKEIGRLRGLKILTVTS